MFSAKIPRGFEAITVSTSAIGPTSTVYKAGKSGMAGNYAVFRVETANVRWRDDGTAPTATVGHLLQVGEVLEYDGDLAAIQFIRKDSADASVTASYYNVQRG